MKCQAQLIALIETITLKIVIKVQEYNRTNRRFYGQCWIRKLFVCDKIFLRLMRAREIISNRIVLFQFMLRLFAFTVGNGNMCRSDLHLSLAR